MKINLVITVTVLGYAEKQKLQTGIECMYQRMPIDDKAKCWVIGIIPAPTRTAP